MYTTQLLTELASSTLILLNRAKYNEYDDSSPETNPKKPHFPPIFKNHSFTLC